MFNLPLSCTDVMEYEPDADMLFNYLLVAALAETTDTVEAKNLSPSEGA